MIFRDSYAVNFRPQRNNIIMAEKIKVRNHAFDFLCGVCIIRMMMRHAMETCQLHHAGFWPALLHWTFFFMSFFFFKAGYFNKTVQGNTLDFLKKKSKQLLVPYVVWGVLGSIVYCGFALCFFDADSAQVKHITWEHLWKTSSFYGNGPCWFLYCFFMAYLAMHLICKCPPLKIGKVKIHLYWIVLGFPFISYYLFTKDNPLILSLNNVFWGIFLFFLGRAWRWVLDHIDASITIFISILLITGFIILNALTDEWYDMGGNLWKGNFFIIASKIILAICGLSGLLLSVNMPRIPVINYIGQHSMVFFVAHYPLLTLYKMLRSTFAHSLKGHWDDLIILSLLIFVFCFWIVPYVEKVPWLSGRYRRQQSTDNRQQTADEGLQVTNEREQSTDNGQQTPSLDFRLRDENRGRGDSLDQTEVKP